MNFNEKLDVQAPAEFTFSELADYETIERMVIQRGVALRRTDRIEGPAAGMSWVAEWEAAGRELKTNISMTRYEPPERMVIETETSGVAGRVQIDVVPLSPKLSRILIETELTPVTFGARILMQPIKLARGAIEKRVGARIGGLAERIESRWAKARTA